MVEEESGTGVAQAAYANFRLPKMPSQNPSNFFDMASSTLVPASSSLWKIKFLMRSAAVSCAPRAFTLAENLLAFRRAKQITQEELAVLCGMNRTYVGSVESAERNVSLSTLEVLAKTLDTTVATLLTPDGHVCDPSQIDRPDFAVPGGGNARSRPNTPRRIMKKENRWPHGTKNFDLPHK